MKYSELLKEGREYQLAGPGWIFRAKFVSDRGCAGIWLLLNTEDPDNHLWVMPEGKLAGAYYKGGPLELKPEPIYIQKPGWEPDPATWEDLTLLMPLPDTQGVDMPGFDTPPTGVDIEALIKHVRHIRARANGLLSETGEHVTEKNGAVIRGPEHTLNPYKEAAVLSELALEISTLSWDLAHAADALGILQGISGALQDCMKAYHELFGTALPCGEDVIVYGPGEVGNSAFTWDETLDANPFDDSGIPF